MTAIQLWACIAASINNSHGEDLTMLPAHKLVNCEDCVAAGHGWDAESSSCGGGFPLRECDPIDISDIEDDDIISSTPEVCSAENSHKCRNGSEANQAGAGSGKSFFAQWTDCESCVSAGHGWCPIKKICGGFANRECNPAAAPVPGYSASTTPEYSDCHSCTAAGLGWDPHRKKCGNFRNKDCSAESPDFMRYKSCEQCVSDGWGWCPILRKCGGFANKKCPEVSKPDSKAIKDAQIASQSAANDVAAQMLRNQMRQIASAKKDGKVAELTADSFEQVVGKEHLIVEFYTEWCGLCRKMEEQYQGLAKHFKGAHDILVAKVNADYSSDLVPRFEVYNYPSYLFFPKGETSKYERFDGRPNLQSLKNAVELSTAQRHLRQEL
jgi:thiol-disulfide isomerase/thioredoxin